jgi:hypothetical protein
MKRIGLVIGVLICLGLGFAGGLYMAFRTINSSLLIQEMGQAALTVHALNHLDKGTVDELRTSLNRRLNGHVLALNGLLEGAKKKDRDSGRKALQMVINYRKNHPFHDAEIPEADAAVNKIISSN